MGQQVECGYGAFTLTQPNGETHNQPPFIRIRTGKLWLRTAPASRYRRQCHLSEPAIRVLALREMGVNNDDIPRVIGQLSSLDLSMLLMIIKRLDQSVDHVIARARENGLEAGVSARIAPPGVRCSCCRQMVVVVPCQLCLLRRGQRCYTDSPDDEVLPEASTRSKPGSGLKIEILVLRAKRGEPLWHPADAG